MKKILLRITSYEFEPDEDDILEATCCLRISLLKIYKAIS